MLLHKEPMTTGNALDATTRQRPDMRKPVFVMIHKPALRAINIHGGQPRNRRVNNALPHTLAHCMQLRRRHSLHPSKAPKILAQRDVRPRHITMQFVQRANIIPEVKHSYPEHDGTKRMTDVIKKLERELVREHTGQARPMQIIDRSDARRFQKDGAMHERRLQHHEHAGIHDAPVMRDDSDGGRASRHDGITEQARDGGDGEWARDGLPPAAREGGDEAAEPARSQARNRVHP